MSNLVNKRNTLALFVLAAIGMSAQAAEIFDPKVQLQHGTSMVEKANLKEAKKLDLEIAILDKEIKETNGDNQKVIDAALKKSQDALEKKYALQIKGYEMRIAKLEKDNDALRGQLGKSEESSSGEKIDIFYTGFMQVGGKTLAEVIVDGSRRTVSIGQDLVPGQRVSAISDNAIKVSVGNGSKYYPLKSSMQIADKLYESALSKVHEERGGMSNMAQPIMLPGSANMLMDNSRSSD